MRLGASPRHGHRPLDRPPQAKHTAGRNHAAFRAGGRRASGCSLCMCHTYHTFAMNIDYGKSRHFCDDPVCSDPVWKSSRSRYRRRHLPHTTESASNVFVWRFDSFRSASVLSSMRFVHFSVWYHCTICRKGRLDTFRSLLSVSVFAPS